MEQFSGKLTLGFGSCLGSDSWCISWLLTPPRVCGWCPRLHTAGIAGAFVSPRALPRGSWSLLLALAAGTPTAACSRAALAGCTSGECQGPLHVPQVPCRCAVCRTASCSQHLLSAQQSTPCRQNSLARGSHAVPVCAHHSCWELAAQNGPVE